MNDLDTDLLRRALRAPQEPGPRSAGRAGPDEITEIITRGRRLRWRRRALAAGGGVCLAAAVFGAVAGIGRLAAPASGPAAHVVSPVGSSRPTRPAPVPSPSPGRGRATPSPVPTATAVPAGSATPTASPSPSASAAARTAPTPTPTMSVSGSVSPVSSDAPVATPSASAGATTVGKQPTAAATSGLAASSMRTDLRPAGGVHRLGR
jgi:hypothetical protein